MDLVRKIWSSPTLTTWGVQSTQVLQLLIFTPLLLSSYDKVEVASWYLFASFNVFGQILLQRINLTFSRMVAFAMAGAHDLSPIVFGNRTRGNGSPSWSVIARLLATMTRLQWVLVWGGSLLAIGLAGFGLQGILVGYARPHVIWISFGIFQILAFVQFFLFRHGATLTGMDKVAINNKRGMAFSLLGIVFGSGSIMLGAPLYVLVLVVQGLLVVNGLVASRMVTREIDGNVSRIDSHYDKDIARWALAPTLRGVVAQIANLGLLPCLSVVIARHGNVTDAATFAFSIRMAATLENASMAPYNSQMPSMSRLATQGMVDGLRSLIFKRVGYSTALLATSLALAWPAFELLIPLISKSLEAPSAELWYALTAYLLLVRYLSICQSICAVTNNVVLLYENISISVVSVVFMFFFSNRLDFFHILAGIAIIQVIFLAVKAPQLAALQLGVRPSKINCQIGGPLYLTSLLAILTPWLVNKVYE